MNSETIFTVKNEDLSRLNQYTSVEFFRQLLWAEARRLGIEISKIDVSPWVNVRDGGVDATVNDVQSEIGQGLIKQDKTSYQIKSGASFKPWQRSTIKAELFGEKTPDRQNLGKSIRACLDDDGTYILVCTGIDPVESQRQQIYSHIEEYLKQCGYSHPKVEVWSQNTLIGFLQVFPSLALLVNGRSYAEFQTHQSWSKNADMQVPFIAAEAQDELIEKIQSELREKVNAVHVRVLGEPGIGKTRLVLEATKAEDLESLVIYCTPAEFRTSGLRREILREDNHFSAILVVDECDPTSRYDIWNELQNQGPRIKLISIYNDYDPVAGSDISELETWRLTDNQISTIIQGHGISEEQAEHYTEFCDGSPRMAHHTGKVLVRHPGDPSQLLSDDYLYRKFYEFGDSQEEVQQRELVLQYVALFKRFGFGGPVIADAQAIAKKIQEANPLITWIRFQKIVDDLKKRKILQGQSTLYITPKALHIKLWVEWWQIYGNSFDLEIFTQDLPPRSKLIEWFHEMFQYAYESEPASRIVKNLLGPNGPFRDGEYLKTRLGSRFFIALTDADPKSALRCLLRTIGTWSREELLEFREGRRSVVWALEKIAVWRELFTDAARLLLILGEAENETAANNASGVFAKLFSLGSGRVAPTEVSPAERFPILEEAFESGSKERRGLALKACSEALEATRFWRISGAEYQGLRKEPKLWIPHGDKELFEAYRRVWKLLSDQLVYLPEDERQEAADILLQRVRGLVRSSEMSDIVVNTLRTFAKQALVDEKQLIKTVVEFLHYEGEKMPAEIRQRWEHLRDELVGSDFHSMMQRYVQMSLLVDRFDENREHADLAQPHIEKLAQQVVDTPSFLQQELPWLVTTEAKDGYRFGYELAKRDEGFAFLPTLLEARRNATDNASEYFLGGYFRAIFEADVAQWESQLDLLVEDTTLNMLIPQIIQYSGMTDQAGLHILKLAKRGIIGINHFSIFGSGKVIERLSDEVFTQWTEFLLKDVDKSTISIVLRLYEHYHVLLKSEPTLPCDLTFRLLTHSSLFQESNTDPFYQMAAYDWTEIGKTFLCLYPEKGLELAAPMLANFGKTGTIVEAHFQTRAVLTEITKQYPSQIWERVSECLEKRDDFLRIHYLQRWLTGESGSSSTDEREGTLPLMPREKIWEWVDGNVEDRARYLASIFGPATLSVEEWQASLARELLVRYGECESVQNNLRANYAIEVSWGPESLHLDEKKQKLLGIREAEVSRENNINVRQWIDKYVAELEEDIERAKVREEREF